MPQHHRIVPQKLIASGCAAYSHPPYERSYYLGPDVLEAIYVPNLPFLRYLIEMGATLDYVGCNSKTNGYTALELALHCGFPAVLKILLSSTTGYGDRKSALLRAIPTAESNITSPHPREIRDFGGYSVIIAYETDLESYNLICNALKNLGVGIPSKSQEDCLSDVGIRCRESLSKCPMSHKSLNIGCLHM